VTKEFIYREGFPTVEVDHPDPPAEIPDSKADALTQLEAVTKKWVTQGTWTRGERAEVLAAAP
jgi:hypothetical protein